MAQAQQGFRTETLVETLANNAACIDKQTLFLSGRKIDGEISRRWCRACPAILACAIYSENISEKVGTWAGITYTTNGTTHV